MNQKFVAILEELDQINEYNDEDVYTNYYKHCGQEWNETADSKCNDRCPECNKEITPYKSKKIVKESEELDEKMINIKKKDEGFYLRHKKTSKLDYGPFRSKEIATRKLHALDNDQEYHVYEFKNELGESIEDLEEGRPPKDRSGEEPKVPKKRGAPKKDKDLYDPEDDEKKEGKRDITLYAYISGGRGKNKQEATENKTLKDASPDNIKKIVSDFENMLTIKFANKWDFDEDEIRIDIKDDKGLTGAKAEDQGKDDDGIDPDDDEASIGTKGAKSIGFKSKSE